MAHHRGILVREDGIEQWLEGRRRDAPAPVSAGHGVSGEGIYPIIHDNATEITQLFIQSPRIIWIIRSMHTSSRRIASASNPNGSA